MWKGKRAIPEIESVPDEHHALYGLPHLFFQSDQRVQGMIDAMAADAEPVVHERAYVVGGQVRLPDAQILAEVDPDRIRDLVEKRSFAVLDR